ncbi:MAG: hypothetical protein V4450_09765 [Bacteroidota bacterium]
MKKLILLFVLFTAMVSQNKAGAQVRLNVNVNIGSQPVWGPVGYDHVDYYYMPDIDAYYYVPERRFIYLESNRWIFGASLPGRYRNYDLYGGYKVVVNEPRPWLRADVYRAKYAPYRGGRGPRQVIIRDSHDNRYKNNGRSYNDHEDNGNGKNKGRGNGKGHDKHDRD